MAFTDLTPDFRQIVARSSLPAGTATKRRNPSSSSSSSSSRRNQEKEDARRLVDREFTREAYSILGHVNSLTRMLSGIRRAYLNVDAVGPSSSLGQRQAPRTFEPGDAEAGAGAAEQTWAGMRSMTNEERDQVDLQAKVILSKCRDRVRQMDELNNAQRAEMSAHASSSLLRFLPSRLRHGGADGDPAEFSTTLFVHRSGITNYLTTRLAAASQAQSEMQEERIRRQSERTRTLGSAATRTLERVSAPPAPQTMTSSASASARSWLGDAASNLAATILLPPSSSSSAPDTTNTTTTTTKPASWAEEDSDSDSDLTELSSSQIHQFESENASILRSVQDTLASVEQAEARLHAIAALQTELVGQLTQQAEMIDQIYDDAVFSTDTVERGNVQLREAKRRAKDGRLYLLVFLVGASLSLLFLHYY